MALTRSDLISQYDNCYHLSGKFVPLPIPHRFDARTAEAISCDTLNRGGFNRERQFFAKFALRGLLPYRSNNYSSLIDNLIDLHLCVDELMHLVDKTEMWENERVRLHKLAKYVVTPLVRKRLGRFMSPNALNCLKFHDLIEHAADIIALKGVMSVYDSEITEHEHITTRKNAVGLSSKKGPGLAEEVILREISRSLDLRYRAAFESRTSEELTETLPPTPSKLLTRVNEHLTIEDFLAEVLLEYRLLPSIERFRHELSKQEVLENIITITRYKGRGPTLADHSTSVHATYEYYNSRTRFDFVKVLDFDAEVGEVVPGSGQTHYFELVSIFSVLHKDNTSAAYAYALLHEDVPQEENESARYGMHHLRRPPAREGYKVLPLDSFHSSLYAYPDLKSIPKLWIETTNAYDQRLYSPRVFVEDGYKTSQRVDALYAEMTTPEEMAKADEEARIAESSLLNGAEEPDEEGILNQLRADSTESRPNRATSNVHVAPQITPPPRILPMSNLPPPPPLTSFRATPQVLNFASRVQESMDSQRRSSANQIPPPSSSSVLEDEPRPSKRLRTESSIEKRGNANHF